MRGASALVTALLVTQGQAANRREGTHPALLAQHVSTNAQVSQILSDLWSQLIIDGEDAIPESDKAVKENFLKDCVLVLDVHEDSKDSVGKVVNKMCSRAGGTAPECTDMTKTLWEAHKDEKLQPWCEKTFDWFAAKTRPRCLKKCKALLCQDRCKEQDKVDDLSDEIAAYKIKLDTASAKVKRFEKIAEGQKEALKKIEKVDKEGCTPAKAEVDKLEKSRVSKGKELEASMKTVKDSETATDKAFETLKKLKSDVKAEKADIAKAEESWKKASATLKKAEDEQGDDNKGLMDVLARLKEASHKEEFQCKKLKEMQNEYDKQKKANDDDLKTASAERRTLQEAMEKVVAKKKKVGSALDASLKAL